MTTTDIYNPTKQTCRLHLDIWHFINVDKNNFKPVRDKLAEEFYSTNWMKIDRARELVTDKSTLSALDFIESNYFNK